MNIKELVTHWREEAATAKRRCAFQYADAMEECAGQLEAQKPEDLLCPTPEVKCLIPVVLYLPDQESVDELIAAFKIAKPNAVAKPL